MSGNGKAIQKHCSEREQVDNSSVPFNSRTVSDSGYTDHLSQSHESFTESIQQPPVKSDPINTPGPGGASGIQ